MIVNPKNFNKRLSYLRSKPIGKFIHHNPQIGSYADTTNNQIKYEEGPKFHLNSSLYEVNIGKERSKSDIKTQTKSKFQSCQLPPLSKRYSSYMEKITSLPKLANKNKEQPELLQTNSVILKKPQTEEEERLRHPRQSHTTIRFYRPPKKQINDNFIINVGTSISTIKQLLIDDRQHLTFSFVIPQVFFNPLPLHASSNQLHQLMTQAFSSVGKIPQIVSIRKFKHCVVMREIKLCILWQFRGKVYFGGWDKHDTLGEGNKHGVGLEWDPGNYLYYGEFRNNQREGYGILNKIDKECYIGCWKNNQKHSYGKTYSKEGKLIVKGQFHEGILRG